jgi:small GTP-binding protein
MKKIIIGILAHVDAGKTTLSESLLYLCGKIRKLGRVDHGDAYLDTYELERERGITIFSKQAQLSVEDVEITLLDTPGHVDFSAEMERTLQVLDYAILVINGTDGVQSHTMTLWRLLMRYQVPVFLFVNKMDQVGTDREKLLEELKNRLDGAVTDFGSDVEPDVFLENVALCEETLLESYLETGGIEEDEIADWITARRIFPCYFGSALKMDGVEEFLQGLKTYLRTPQYPETFGAKVYKIARDEQGSRLTYMKITGGSLKVKALLRGTVDAHREGEEGCWEEKADQLRVYSGAKYEMISCAEAGSICAVTGLTHTYPGEGLGAEPDSDLPVLEPVLNYRIFLPEDVDVHQMLLKLRQLEEEEPQLHIRWDEQLGEIHAQLMGEIQTEILKSMIWERFHVAVEFGSGNIVYKETIAAPVEGVGHYEPLRHYAEVHLLLEPGERGSGLQFYTACSEDSLARNWQRLILTHLEEKEHLGVLTGSPVTDIQITLVAGRAHQKHTEGGDFRQATYRAIRQGLKKAKNILLEPYYEFRLEIPGDMLGRAMTDIQKMKGSFGTPQMEGDLTVLTGTAPVSGMRDYQREVVSYTKGQGKLFCSLKGYAPCENQDEIVEAIGYDSERDMENPTSSVFCSHGAGFLVPWYQVEEYAHLENMEVDAEEEGYEDGFEEEYPPAGVAARRAYSGSYEDEKELQAIFERTFGPVKRSREGWQKKVVQAPSESRRKTTPVKKQDEYLLVDGYNIIFSWDDLRELSESNIDAARDRLMDILSNYQGYKKCTLILVFDAYKQQGHREEIVKYHNIHIVYTKEAETADQYIEKTVHRIGRQNQVTVATSDGLEQVIIMGQGAVRLSASDLREEIEAVQKEIQSEWIQRRTSSRNYLIDQVSDEMAGFMQDVRLGRKEI